MLGSIFPDKIEFDGKNYRTKSYNRILDVIYQETNHLRGQNKAEFPENSENSVSVPGAGIEPARIAPLVFETSASTDSAIWAYALTATGTGRSIRIAKVSEFFENAK